MLEELRKDIDKIDDEITALYRKRMNIAAHIADEKKLNGQTVADLSREKKVLNRVTAQMPDDLKFYTKQLFRTLFDTSRAYQSGYLCESSPAAESIRAIVKDGFQTFPVSGIVACQGAEGAYSNLAADKMFEIADIMYFKDFDGVFNAVEKGLCAYGVLPIENSTAGSVNTVYDAMRKHRFYIVRAVRLHIRHALLAKKGTASSKITKIYSHEQALAQCSEFLKNNFPNAQLIDCENTAVAARTVMQNNDESCACIASPECAALYGLAALQTDIQDNDNNYTRFICISKKLNVYKGAEKISVMTSLSHEPGSLNRALNRFAALGLNLTKLESRPLPKSLFEFMFYFDFIADISDEKVINLIAQLQNESSNFVFLGSYKEAE